MTAQEIRETLPPMVLKMASATIRQARLALTGSTGWNDVKRSDYNLPEVEMANRVLFQMFGTHEFAIRQALMRMPKELDGVHGRNYFSAFVESLGEYIGHESVRLRKVEDPERHQPKKKSREMER